MPLRQPAFSDCLAVKQGWQLRYNCASLLPSCVFMVSVDKLLMGPLLGQGVQPSSDQLSRIAKDCRSQINLAWQLRLAAAGRSVRPSCVLAGRLFGYMPSRVAGSLYCLTAGQITEGLYAAALGRARVIRAHVQQMRG